MMAAWAGRRRLVRRLVFAFVSVTVVFFVTKSTPSGSIPSAVVLDTVSSVCSTCHPIDQRQLLEDHGSEALVETPPSPTPVSTKSPPAPVKPSAAKHRKASPVILSNDSQYNVTTSTQAADTKRNPILEECTPVAYHEFPPDLFTREQRAGGAIIIHFLVVLYMFYALAVVCDYYFVASMEECCSRLNLSEDVAGATFMAAGSSAPELFTAILGVLIAKGDVGTGTIVGSAVFNILFVIGICGLFAGRVVDLSWWSLVRDSSYYAFTVIVLILIIYDSKVSWYESLIMLCLYVVYIIIMKYNTQCRRLTSKLLGIAEDEPPSAMGILSQNYDKKSYSSYVPFNNEIDEYAQLPITSDGTKSTATDVTGSRKRMSLYEAALKVMSNPPFPPLTRFRCAGIRVIHQIRKSKERKVLNQTSVDAYDPLSGSRKSISMSAALSPQENWRRSPSKEDGILGIAKWIVQAPLLATLYYTIPDCKKNQWRSFFLLTFFMSILWTAIFSYIMVWMVTLIGFTLGIPDSIMGITFLAAGTSIPDAFASLLVAKQGQGDMAVSNSIGSNVFDILVGLALPWFIQTTMVEPGSLATINSRGLVYSVILLFLTIIATVGGVHMSGWQLTQRLGVFLLVTYGIFLIFCGMLEFNVMGYVNPPMCPE